MIHKLLLMQFDEILKEVSNASFDCGEFDWDGALDSGAEYDKLLAKSAEAKARIRKLFIKAIGES